MTPAGIEPATFRFVAQHVNHCATAFPHYSSSALGKSQLTQPINLSDNFVRHVEFLWFFFSFALVYSSFILLQCDFAEGELIFI